MALSYYIIIKIKTKIRACFKVDVYNCCVVAFSVIRFDVCRLCYEKGLWFLVSLEDGSNASSNCKRSES